MNLREDCSRQEEWQVRRPCRGMEELGRKEEPVSGREWAEPAAVGGALRGGVWLPRGSEGVRSGRGLI